MLSQLQVGPIPAISLPDGQTPTWLAGKSGEAIVSKLHGKYYTQAYRGRCFIGATAVGGVVPAAFNSTTPTFMLWNPATSGRNFELIKLQAGLVTAGTFTGGLCLAYLTGAGAQLGTGTAILTTTTTLVAPVNACLGNPTKSLANFAPATITLTTGASFLKSCGLGTEMDGSPGAVNNYWQLTEYYDGDIIVPPGAAIFVCANVLQAGSPNTAVATWDIGLAWCESPI